VIERANVLVLGGGVVGTSIAWALAQRGVDDVVVVDLDLAGIYASSELNAGGARATWWQPVNIESCRETLAFFDSHREHLGFRRAGYLWLYDDEVLWGRALEKRVLQNGHGLGIERLDAGEVGERFPLLDRKLEEIVGATFSPGDGLVNPNAVRMFYREEARALGVRFENRHYASGVSTALTSGPGGSQRRVDGVDVVEVAAGGVLEADGVVREILTSHHVPPDARRREQRIQCGTLVNALGAWSPVFSAKIGIADVSEPVRRQISLVDVHPEDMAEGASFEGMGMVVDASGLYMHPEGRHLLAGYSIEEEPPGFDFAYDGADFFEQEIWPRLAHRASSFERCGHVRGWSGLYAVTPDRSGIAGPVRGFANLFEAHSFTGRGVMQSYAVGRSLAARIASGGYEGVDLSPLARDRFTDRGRWVLEELHI
jgi:sarcosine oxidase subunit beta